ncbi:hypothetical protein NON00_05765 [Roseomonas sp. GC11]|uniref:hypothetical protein n=1 Tax=Roseomonas sp. GC11 TaxID=2950546 RepID=UPI00210CFB51|nr:hypothetical protein [Roseomonas sp. GC11]MCQ4159429.1 hypothetical protein [Roseomonas sp. GC11]
MALHPRLCTDKPSQAAPFARQREPLAGQRFFPEQECSFLKKRTKKLLSVERPAAPGDGGSLKENLFLQKKKYLY